MRILLSARVPLLDRLVAGPATPPAMYMAGLALFVVCSVWASVPLGGSGGCVCSLAVSRQDRSSRPLALIARAHSAPMARRRFVLSLMFGPLNVPQTADIRPRVASQIWFASGARATTRPNRCSLSREGDCRCGISAHYATETVLPNCFAPLFADRSKQRGRTCTFKRRETPPSPDKC